MMWRARTFAPFPISPAALLAFLGRVPLFFLATRGIHTSAAFFTVHFSAI